MHTWLRFGWLGFIAAFPLFAGAACPDHAAVTAYVEDFKASRASKGFGTSLTPADVSCARMKVAKELQGVLGSVVGYKAGFTNPKVQQLFGISEPDWGVMFEKMMVASGAKIPAKFGAFPSYEADLIAVVKDAGLVDAKSPLEALRHISEIVAFIELPDRMIGGKVSASELVATNLAFRGGVLGARVKVEASQAFLDAMANMTVVLSEDKGGKELGRTQGSALMDNPVNAAIWLARALKKEGIVLKSGDLLSLGGFFPAARTSPGTTITVKYLGLRGDLGVTVHFE
jgi:2-oxo-hept-3-ene-1,7-dioate hydratase